MSPARPSLATASEGWRWSDLSALPELAERDAAAGRVPDALALARLRARRPAPAVRRRQAGRRAEQSRPDRDRPGRAPSRATIRWPAWPAARAGAAPRPRPCAARARPDRPRLDRRRRPSRRPRSSSTSMPRPRSSRPIIGDGWTNRLSQIRLFKGARLMLSRRLLGDGGFVSLTDRAEVGEGASFVVRDPRRRRRRHPPRRRRSAWPARAPMPRRPAPCSRAAGSVTTPISSSATPSPSGTSRQVWRSVADDRATCSVAARVEVARDAQKTDGEQSLKGLLLAPHRDDQRQARARDLRRRRQMRPRRHRRRARPQRALLPRQPRRRRRTRPRRLLTRAFVADALDRIGEEAVREAFYADAESLVRA